MRFRRFICFLVVLLWSFVAQADVVHVVQRGETLGEICKRHNVSLNAVITHNPRINPNRIKPGQRVKIPAKASPKSSEFTTSKPIDQKKSSAPTIHVVQHGDTLWKIAKKYGSSVAELRKLNNLKSNVLHTEQKLMVRKASPPPKPRFTYITPKVKTLIDSPKKIKHWQYIIVHHSGTPSGNAKIFGYYHSNMRHMENGLAYHFIIGNGTDSSDGEIEVGDRWRDQLKGGHVSNDDLNEVSLGICLVGNFNKKRPSPKQIASLVELIRYLNSIIPGKHPKFTTHREAQPNHTACPGHHLPFQALHKIFD